MELETGSLDRAHSEKITSVQFLKLIGCETSDVHINLSFLTLFLSLYMYVFSSYGYVFYS